MTHRERVLAAIAHKEADRVPIDHGSMRSTGIMAIAYNRLKRHLGISEGHTYLYDVIQQLAEPEQWYLDRFGVDAVDLGRAFTPSNQWQPWTLPDGTEALAPAWFQPERRDGSLIVRDASGIAIGHMPKDSLYLDQCYWPLSGSDGLDNYEPLAPKMAQVTWAALPTAPGDLPMTEERLNEIAAVARHYHETTDYAISLAVGCNLLEWSQFLFGMENTFVYMAGEKEKFGKFLDHLTEIHLEGLSRLLPKVRGSVDVLVLGDDLGMQTGPQMSRSMYRELFKPRHKKIYEFAKKASGGAHIFMHNCGGVYELIPELIEAGVEILNPVQTTAKNMQPERLKKEFGKDITFWGGGCNTQTVLSKGTPGEIREDVRRRMEIFMPGGGFVWNQIHNVMSDVPPENFLAMMDAVREFARY